MFFYIDESGNTGNNLFDQSQPVLSYGLLSSKTNVDVLGGRIHAKILNEIGEDSIHANILGVDRLTSITPYLVELQKKFKFKFDYYFIDKLDYALVHFFDAVFDAGINPAVKWDTYWTPLRFVFIWKLAVLLDRELLKLSWGLCIDKNIDRKEEEIESLLKEVLRRVHLSPLDDRTKELMDSALRFGISNPLKVDFGRSNPNMVSPNAVCFQFVVAAMARHMRCSGRKNALGIIIDQQSQFNKSQILTMDQAYNMSKSLNNASPEEQKKYRFHPLFRQFDESDVLGKGIPNKEVSISNSGASIGLQIVDVYLWLANRRLNNSPLSNELNDFSDVFLKNALIDGISLDGMMSRWKQFEALLPKSNELDHKILSLAEDKREEHRKVIRDLRDNGDLYNG